MNTRIYFAIGVAVLSANALVGCSDKTHQTVEWYMEHKAEREEKLKWCNNDMSRALEVDCLNATKAKERAMLQGSGAAETFKFDASAVKHGEAANTPKKQSNSGASAADTFKFDPTAAQKGGK